MRDLIVRKVNIIDFNGSTVMSFEDSIIGLSELSLRYIKLKKKCDQYVGDEKVKFELIKSLLQFVCVLNSAFYNNFFYDTIKLLPEDHDLIPIVNEIKEFNIRDYILKQNSDQLIEYLAYYDAKNDLYRFSDEYVFTDYGNIEEFNEYMLEMNRVEFENIEESYEKFLTDDSTTDEDESKDNQNVEIQLYNYPLHPAFVRYLNNIIIETKNFQCKVQACIYAEYYLKTIKEHPLLSKYENDISKAKLLISGTKKASLSQNAIKADPNVAYTFTKTLIKTIYNDSTELVSHIFDKFLKNKSYEFFKNLAAKFTEYNLENFDDCQNFMLDVFDILNESDMSLEVKCLDHLLASDTSLNKNEFLIISELFKHELEFISRTPAFQNKFKEEIENDKGEDGRKK